MTRRTTAQSKTDEGAFPVRVFIKVPSLGFGNMNAMHSWLDKYAGRASYAIHGGSRSMMGDTIAAYFRDPKIAFAFMLAFPELELADGTMQSSYYSPHAPRGNAADEEFEVCNLYNQTMAADAMRQLFANLENRTGNLEPGDIYPDRLAPIIRHRPEGLELARARWGMPSPRSVLKTARDPGVTNVRNLSSPHWRRWLGPAHRCLVPVTAFAEPKPGGNQWFAPAQEGMPMFFAGIEVRGWKSLRKVKEGETVDDLFAFVICAPNAEVASVHPKAMPVILTKPTEWETWMGAPFEIAAQLQRSLADGSLVPLHGSI